MDQVPQPRGPRVLFFSGGTALRETCAHLKRLAKHSVHIISPFDSGGSSATLREAFGIPAVGDLRNRALALAGCSDQLHRLLGHRLHSGQCEKPLREELASLAQGTHSLLVGVSGHERYVVTTSLAAFQQSTDAKFVLEGACVGNLVIVGLWLCRGRRLREALDAFVCLVQAQGRVRLLTERNLHLGFHMSDGSTTIGQHRVTGTKAERGTVQAHATQQVPSAPTIQSLFLCRARANSQNASLLSGGSERVERVRCEADAEVWELCHQAELICFPMGSFFTSVLAHFLVSGVGGAVRASRATKVYVPNSDAWDHESRHLSLRECVMRLVEGLHRSCAPNDQAPARGVGETPAQGLLDMVLVDRANGVYEGLATSQDWGAFERWLGVLGVALVDAALVKDLSSRRIDGAALSATLLKLATRRCAL